MRKRSIFAAITGVVNITAAVRKTLLVAEITAFIDPQLHLFQNRHSLALFPKFDDPEDKLIGAALIGDDGGILNPVLGAEKFFYHSHGFLALHQSGKAEAGHLRGDRLFSNRLGYFIVNFSADAGKITMENNPVGARTGSESQDDNSYDNCRLFKKGTRHFWQHLTSFSLQRNIIQKAKPAVIQANMPMFSTVLSFLNTGSCILAPEQLNLDSTCNLVKPFLLQ
ncbi:MAG: hypothetical protein AB1767_09815 [Bacillota bacterium]